jgi:hypothetical protein
MPLSPVPGGTEPVEFVPLWPGVSPELCPALLPELWLVALTWRCPALHPTAIAASKGKIAPLQL